MSTEELTSELAQEVDTIPLAEFLESIPPSQSRPVSATVEPLRELGHGRWEYRVTLPEIQIHCLGSSCNGPRFFRSETKYLLAATQSWNNGFAVYICGNCQKQAKTFALAVSVELARGGLNPSKVEHLHCYKLGEHPVYGPPTPARLISLIGPDRDLFLKGRRCENQGPGIGAFGYYRRVVENQKNRILGEIIKVAQSISAPPEAIAALQAAQNDQQFSKAIDGVKDAIPQRLLIEGQNPLTLLHTALSKGLHNHSDEVCLELATDIRLILAELADLLGQALKDERELREAVARLRKLPP